MSTALPGLTARQYDKLATLRRRRDFLEGRVANYRPDGDPSRDKAELGALNFAIAVIEGCAMAGILDEVSR